MPSIAQQDYLIFTPSNGSSGQSFLPSNLTQEEQNLLVEYVERKAGLSVVFHEEANPDEGIYEGYYLPSSVEYDPATRRAWYELKSWQGGYRLKVQWRPIEVNEEA